MSADVRSSHMRVTTNASWLIVCRVGSDFLSLLLFVVISRSFGPAGIGEFSYGFAIATLLLVIATLGIDSFGVREYSQIAPANRSTWMAELLGTQIVVVAMAVSGLFVYLLLTRAAASTWVVVAALTSYQVLVALARTLFIPAISAQQMVGPAVLDLICRATAVGVAVFLIKSSATSVAWALVGFPLAGVLLLVVAAMSAFRQDTKLGIKISRNALHKIGLALWSYAAAELIAQIFARIGLFVLAIESGVAATGLYAAGLKLLELACMPLVFLGVAAYPRLIQQHGANPAAFRNLANRLLWVMVLTSGGIAWGLYYVAPALVIPILGAKFVGTESVVRAMAAVAVVQAAEAIMWPVLLAAGLQIARLRAISAATLLSLALNVLLIPRFGVNGAILASFLSLLTIVFLFCLPLRSVLGPRLMQRPILALAVSIFVAVATALCLKNQGFSVQGFASIVAFLGAALAMFWRFGRTT
jgi:O-antigen/teichoic acid export membrane protein